MKISNRKKEIRKAFYRSYGIKWATRHGRYHAGYGALCMTHQSAAASVEALNQIHPDTLHEVYTRRSAAWVKSNRKAVRSLGKALDDTRFVTTTTTRAKGKSTEPMSVGFSLPNGNGIRRGEHMVMYAGGRAAASAIWERGLRLSDIRAMVKSDKKLVALFAAKD